MDITTPVGRGNGSKAWACGITSVTKNASSGRDWSGPWMVSGAAQEVDLGDLIVVGDADGCGAAVYAAYEQPMYMDGVLGAYPAYLMIECDPTKKWGAKLAIAVRKWLAMDTADRVQAVLQTRLDSLEGFVVELPTRPDKTYLGATGTVALERLTAAIALCRSMLSTTGDSNTVPAWATDISDADLRAEMSRRGL